jgi:hypothetical protein
VTKTFVAGARDHLVLQSGAGANRRVGSDVGSKACLKLYDELDYVGMQQRFEGFEASGLVGRSVLPRCGSAETRSRGPPQIS